MNIRIVKFISLIAVVMIVSLVFVGKARAQSEDLLRINFQNGNDEPLFTEINFLPGDAVTRYVEVINLSEITQAVVVKTETATGSNALTGFMNIKIDDDKDVGTAPIYASTLSDFFALPSLYLGNLLTGASSTYYFSIELNIDTPNTMQKAGLSFDIVVGEGTIESFTLEPKSSSKDKISDGTALTIKEDTYPDFLIQMVQKLTMLLSLIKEKAWWIF